MCNKYEKIKEVNENLEGEQSMSAKLQISLKNEIICRSQVSKSPSVSKAMKSKVENAISCAKQIELDCERKKLDKDVVIKKIQLLQTELTQHKNKIV